MCVCVGGGGAKNNKLPVCIYIQDVYGVHHASTCACTSTMQNEHYTTLCCTKGGHSFALSF